jgi:hypothetical protein
MHAAALLVVLNIPLPHAAHVRSACAVPALATDCPAAQVVNAPHEAAFFVELNVPLAQARQVRLAVAEPAKVTN